VVYIDGVHERLQRGARNMKNEGSSSQRQLCCQVVVVVAGRGETEGTYA
jgi:hypothetical protein